MWSGRTAFTIAAALLAALPCVTASGHGHEDMIGSSSMNSSNSSAFSDEPTNYFHYPHYSAWIQSHIALMILGWAMILPVAIMLSIARYRYHLSAQLLFHVFNGLGTFTGFVYNHATPDLYVKNAHHPIGWVVTSITAVWTIVSLVVAFSPSTPGQKRHQISTHSMAHYDGLQNYNDTEAARYSRDSGQGTERNSASLLGSRQTSSESFLVPKESPTAPTTPHEDEHHDGSDPEDGNANEKHGLLRAIPSRFDSFLTRQPSRLISPRATTALRLTQIILEKFLLPLAFLALTTGIVTYTGLFRAREVFSGLAHWIKGGIFLGYGLLTLGRWMGAFAEFGWAWNLRPPLVAVPQRGSPQQRWKARVPSAEFTESSVICLYGASNVFLEHLNGWGKQWSAQDLEHVSITLLFFGGGLLGMLVESSRAREFLDTSVALQQHVDAPTIPSETGNEPTHTRLTTPWQPPVSARHSLNPLPALVILLLGLLMSAHHQASATSTMLHATWGHLLSAFALARLATYALLYVSPPTSHYPARPPTELVSAFCLVAGGAVFMLSARGVVQGLEAVGVEAMAVVTVVLGASGVVMAWGVVVYAVKGWAVRREVGRGMG